MQQATCPCGHVGKSKTPKWYRCGRCYYANRATGNRKRAGELRARAEKLDAEALKFEAKSAAFAAKHPVAK